MQIEVNEKSIHAPGGSDTRPFRNVQISYDVTVHVGRGGWLKMSYVGGRGWLKTSEYRHMEEGSKIAQKQPSYDI